MTRCQLSVPIGNWADQVNLPGVPLGRTTFDWVPDGQYLLQLARA